MKKELFSLLLSAALLVSATACNRLPEKETDQSAETTAVSSENDRMILIPETYAPVIHLYRDAVEHCLEYSTTMTNERYFSDPEEKELLSALSDSALALYPRDTDGLVENGAERFGYTLMDLNSDGNDELILRLDDHQVIAVFTLKDGKPKMVDHFWNRYTCRIDPDGCLHTGGSNGADHSVIIIYRLSETGDLIVLAEGGTDGVDETGNTTRYYNVNQGIKEYLSKDAFDEWLSEIPYHNMEIPEQWNFIPLFDKEHPASSPCVYIEPAKG